MAIDISKASNKIFGGKNNNDDIEDGAVIENAVQQNQATPIDIQSAKQKVTGSTSLETIAQGLPNNGRILRDNNTGKLHFVSKTYTTNDQDEIKSIIDSFSVEGGKLNTEDYTPPAQKMESTINKEYLEELPEAGLLGQQLMRGTISTGSWMDDAMTDNPLEQFKYEKTREAYEQEYPERAYPAQAAGLIGSTYLTGGTLNALGKAPKLKGVTDTVQKWYNSLPPLGQKAVKVGGTSALAGTEGLFYGAGDGSNSDERTTNALQTGGMNAAITAPLQIAFPWVGKLFDRFNLGKAQDNAIATEFNISIEAARLIKEAFDSGSTINEMMDKVLKSGDDRMIADATEAFQKLLDGAATVSPKLGGEVQNVVGQRVQDSSTRLAGDLDSSLGVQPQGQQTILQSVADSTKQARGDAYKTAFEYPVDYATKEGKQILRTLTSLPRKTIDSINSLLEMQGKTKRIKYKGVDKNGKVIFDELPDTETLNLIKIELDKVAEGSRDAMSGNIVGIDNMIADEARKSLRNNLKAINPYYAKALQQGQGKILTQQAIVLGGKVLNDKTTLDEVKNVIKSASREEMMGLRQGLREQIENAMSTAKRASTTGKSEEVAEAMKIVTAMSSRSVRLKLEQILGKKTSDAMFKRLDETRSAIELQAATRTGSGTASRAEIMKKAEDMVGGGPIDSLFRLQPSKAVSKLRDFFAGNADESMQGQKEKMFKEIADLLTKTGKGGSDVDTALKYLEAVRRGEKLTKPQSAYLTLLVKNGLQSTSAPVATGVGTQRYMTNEQ